MYFSALGTNQRSGRKEILKKRHEIQTAVLPIEPWRRMQKGLPNREPRISMLMASKITERKVDPLIRIVSQLLVSDGSRKLRKRI